MWHGTGSSPTVRWHDSCLKIINRLGCPVAKAKRSFIRAVFVCKTMVIEQETLMNIISIWGVAGWPTSQSQTSK